MVVQWFAGVQGLATELSQVVAALGGQFVSRRERGVLRREFVTDVDGGKVVAPRQQARGNREHDDGPDAAVGKGWPSGFDGWLAAKASLPQTEDDPALQATARLRVPDPRGTVTSNSPALPGRGGWPTNLGLDHQRCSEPR